MKFKEFQHQPVKPDTYEASMALNQLMKIGKHAIKIHNMIDDSAEMESWVAKKIDLAGDYVKKVHGYMQGEKAGLYDDGGMTEDAGEKIANMAQNMTKDEFMSHADELGLTPEEAAEHYEKMSGGAHAGKFDEEAPFGSGMDLVRMAVLRKFISAEEYMAYGKELKAAAEETAEHYDDWPDGEGFGSSDGNFAIRDMMSAAGYEFDEQDRSGSFIVTKMPEKLEKMGIKNARMRDAVTTDSLEARLEAKLSEVADKQDMAKEIAKMYDAAYEYINDSSDNPSDIESDYKFGYNDDDSMEAEDLAAAFRQDYDRGMALQKQLQAQREKDGREGDWDPFNPESMYHAELKALMSKAKGESVSEDAGEGHMSKSTLYHTAKYAIALMDMIKPGDDLEGWVQSKLNKAADYLQGVHNYEEYQKLNPYREELDSNILQKHAGIVQKNIDEILARETRLDDLDTKPGMMRILAKRVNEVEKEMAKENRKNTDEAHGGQHTTSGRSMTKGEMNKREKIVKGMKKDKAGFKKRYGKDAEAVMYATATKQAMKDDVDYRSDDVLIKAGFDPAMVKKYIAVFNDHGDTSDIDQMNMDKIGLADAMSMTLASHGIENESVEESGILYRAGVKKYGKAGMKAIQSAAGKGASHQEIGKIKDKHLKDDEQMQEGIKDWAKNLAMAGVIVAGLAGVGSIQDAIDRSVPAVQAMETALELATDQGNKELADMIKKDLSAVKVRLSSGKDLGFVKGMQEKYSKFVQTEGLAYESKLTVMLNQQLK